MQHRLAQHHYAPAALLSLYSLQPSHEPDLGTALVCCRTAMMLYLLGTEKKYSLRALLRPSLYWMFSAAAGAAACWLISRSDSAGAQASHHLNRRHRWLARASAMVVVRTLFTYLSCTSPISPYCRGSLPAGGKLIIVFITPVISRFPACSKDSRASLPSASQRPSSSRRSSTRALCWRWCHCGHHAVISILYDIAFFALAVLSAYMPNLRVNFHHAAFLTESPRN